MQADSWERSPCPGLPPLLLLFLSVCDPSTPWGQHIHKQTQEWTWWTLSQVEGAAPRVHSWTQMVPLDSSFPELTRLQTQTKQEVRVSKTAPMSPPSGQRHWLPSKCLPPSRGKVADLWGNGWWPCRQLWLLSFPSWTQLLGQSCREDRNGDRTLEQGLEMAGVVSGLLRSAGDRWLSEEAGVGPGQVLGHDQSEGRTGDFPLLSGFTSGPFFHPRDAWTDT